MYMTAAEDFSDDNIAFNQTLEDTQNYIVPFGYLTFITVIADNCTITEDYNITFYVKSNPNSTNQATSSIVYT